MESIIEFVQKNARVLVAALVIIGTVTLVSFSGDNKEENTTDQNDQQTTSEATEKNDDETAVELETKSSEQEVVIGSEPDAGPVEVAEDKSIYTATVRGGDNQTVIVRQMVQEFLSDEAKSLTAEQRLFVETSVVDSLPRNDSVEVGDKIDIEKSVLATAVETSEALSEQQLGFWSRYL